MCTVDQHSLHSQQHRGFHSGTYCVGHESCCSQRWPQLRAPDRPAQSNPDLWWWLHTSPRLTHAMLLTSLVFFFLQVKRKGGRCRAGHNNTTAIRVENEALMCRNAGAMPPLSVAHYCTTIAQKHTSNAAFGCASSNTHTLSLTHSLSLGLSCDPPVACSPHPLPCPNKAFLLHGGRCNLRSKIPLSPCGKFRHTAGPRRCKRGVIRATLNSNTFALVE